MIDQEVKALLDGNVFQFISYNHGTCNKHGVEVARMEFAGPMELEYFMTMELIGNPFMTHHATTVIGNVLLIWKRP